MNEGETMLRRSVYEVLVVKQSDGVILSDRKVVATNSEAAVIKLKDDFNPDECEFVILKLGDLRPMEEVVNREVKL